MPYCANNSWKLTAPCWLLCVYIHSENAKIYFLCIIIETNFMPAQNFGRCLLCAEKCKPINWSCCHFWVQLKQPRNRNQCSEFGIELQTMAMTPKIHRKILLRFFCCSPASTFSWKRSFSECETDGRIEIYTLSLYKKNSQIRCLNRTSGVPLRNTSTNTD